MCVTSVVLGGDRIHQFLPAIIDKISSLPAHHLIELVCGAHRPCSKTGLTTKTCLIYKLSDLLGNNGGKLVISRILSGNQSTEDDTESALCILYGFMLMSRDVWK